MEPCTGVAATESWPALVCPRDGSPVARTGTDQAAGLLCAQGHAWRETLGIPRMVGREGGYADAFGLQWNVHRRTQLDSYSGLTISRDRARRCIGDPCWQALQRPGRVHVLEVGCGAGRFTEVLLSTGACVTSVDLSSAVEANQENFPQNDRHRVTQADVLALPFSPGQYDLVFCLGVVQHTPSPEMTLARLYAQVKRGGWLVLDHYRYSLSYLTKSAPLFRLVLRRLPPEQGLRWTDRLVRGLLPLHRAVRRSRVAQALLSRISPVSSFYHVFPLDDALQRQWALLETHDALTDWYKRFRTRGQIRRELERLGGTDIWCAYGGNGVEARARRPATTGAQDLDTRGTTTAASPGPSASSLWRSLNPSPGSGVPASILGDRQSAVLHPISGRRKAHTPIAPRGTTGSPPAPDSHRTIRRPT